MKLVKTGLKKDNTNQDSSIIYKKSNRNAIGTHRKPVGQNNPAILVDGRLVYF